MVYDTARALAAELKASEEYKTYQQTREAAMANDTTKALIAEYHKLQRRAQGVVMQGG